MSADTIGVFVVDDSRVHRAALRASLEAEGDIRVVGMASDVETALTLIDGMRPAVVAVDAEMLGASSASLIANLVERQISTIVLVAEPDHADHEVIFAALAAGAHELVPKPLLADADGSALLRSCVRHLASPFTSEPIALPSSPRANGSSTPGLVAVVASHGGLPSVLELLTALPASLPCPFVVHTTTSSGIGTLLAEHAHRVSRRRVLVAHPPELRFEEGDLVLSLGRNVKCVGRRSLRVEPDAPCAAELLRSVVRVHGSNATAVILDGRDPEGAEGLEAFVARKAPIFVRPPNSAVVAELPRAALTRAGSDALASLSDIIGALCARTSSRRSLGASRG